MSRPLVSVIVPVYNSAELVAECQAALSSVLDGMTGGAEVIYVDDGSSDDTLDALRQAQARDPRVRIVELAANFGQHAAFTAGFDQARGRYLVTLDVDLQCDPADIPRLIEPLTRGYDLVSGIRRNRQDPAGRRMFSRATTALVTRLAGVPLTDIGCPLNAFTDDVARSLAAFGELRRFLKPLAVRVARRVTEVEVRHRPRPANRRASSYQHDGADSPVHGLLRQRHRRRLRVGLPDRAGARRRAGARDDRHGRRERGRRAVDLLCRLLQAG